MTQRALPADLDPELGTPERALLHADLNGTTLLEASAWNGVALWWFVDGLFHQYMRGAAAPSHARRGIAGRMLSSVYDQFLAAEGRFSQRHRPTLDTGKPRVLYTAHNVSYRPEQPDAPDAVFGSLVREWTRQNQYEVISTAPLTGFPENWLHQGIGRAIVRQRHRAGQHHVPFFAYAADAHRVVQSVRRLLRAKWHDLERPLARAMDALGMAPGDLPAIKGLFVEDCARAAGMLHGARHLLAHAKPAIVMMQNETGDFERALCVAAREAGLPVVALQHGVIASSDAYYHPGRKHVQADGGFEELAHWLPTKTLVASDDDAAHLTNKGGYPRSLVQVCGMPRHDELVEAVGRVDPNQWKRQQGLPENQPLILWATQTHGTSPAETDIMVATLRAAAKRAGAAVAVKLHPAEDPAAAPYQPADGSWHILDGKANIAPWLAAADVVVVRHSTVGWEAAGLGKTVVACNLVDDAGVELARSYGGLVAQTPEALTAALHASIARTSAVPQQSAGPIMDGGATQRVLDVVDGLVGRTADAGPQTD